MIVSVAIVTGFQNEITRKVVGFGAHIQISNYDKNNSFEAEPVYLSGNTYELLDSLENVDHIQVFANKAGIIKTDEEIQGVVLKGAGPDFNWNFFNEKIIEGEPLKIITNSTSDNVLISRSLADLLKLSTGNPLRMYFISADGSKTRGRRFNISGIYETGLQEFDILYVIGDIKHIQKLNNWSEDQAGGIEIFLKDFSNLDETNKVIFENISYDLDSRTIKDLHPQIFDWLELQDMNVIIIIILMILVSSIAMVSTLLILILERTNMIGILKALGYKNANLRKIFLYHAAYILILGLFWGNLFGISICLFQYYTGIIGLPQESYYMDVVPVNLNLLNVLMINLGSVFICMIILIFPSYIISRITPIRAIRFS